MDRNEFIFATAILLFGAFCLGFFVNWVVTRLSHVSKSDIDDLDKMAEALHHAEEERDSMKAEAEAKEGRLRGQIARKDAELEAAMEGLRTARMEAEELRAFVESKNMAGS